MIGMAEADLPAAAGPGTSPAKIAAVERNIKAVSFLTAAMPDSLLVNVTAAGESDPDWPDQAKAHLMITYLKSTFEDTTTLSRVGAKRDLENCKMSKEDNPKVLFEKLVAVKFKYAGNRQANITENDIITQAIQTLPSLYNSTVHGLIDAERRAEASGC
jgi:gag-polypeptide of LTR copia-type